ncbi:MAG TPA: hydrogenase maturation protease [Candidatus Nanopelagicales bacterium]|nr:hydrogenase maturation protease [Candidatus Nanopelagicales bacterium]
MTSRVPVFVCGEPARGDDAAGFAAVELLAPEVRARAEIVPVGQLDVLLLLDLPADEPCVVVDAVAGLAPGEIWVRPLAALVDRARARADAGRAPEPRSSHELPLEQVLALAAMLRDAPPAGTFVGIGGTCWDLGTPLTAPVAAGLPAFAAAIAAAVEAAVEAREARATT